MAFPSDTVSRYWATAQIAFNAPFPSGSSWVGLVRLDGEVTPKRQMICDFQNTVDANGNVRATVRFVGPEHPKDFFRKGRIFELRNGTDIAAKGTIIGIAPERSPGPPAVFNSTSGYPFE